MRKSILVLSVVLAGVLCLNAQVPTLNKKDVITGSMSINFATRTQTQDGVPQKGVFDEYKLNFVVADTTMFRGTVQHTPIIFDKYLGMEAQAGMVKYSLDLGVRNPSDLTQEKMIGKLTGAVPLNKEGEYVFNNGDMRIAIDPVGKASAFESRFKGVIGGKKPQADSALDQIKKQTVSLTRMVGGKTVTLKVNDYDPMIYKNTVMAAGPAAVYPEARVNGDMLFDYARSSWYFNNLTIIYSIDGKECVDVVTGNIKWTEDTGRSSNGLGQYELNVRINEEQTKKADKTESAAFQGMDDEAMFFSTDVSIPCLTGTIKYKDMISEDTVISSETTYNLDSNSLTKIQIVNLFKLLCLINIIPMNSE